MEVSATNGARAVPSVAGYDGSNCEMAGGIALLSAAKTEPVQRKPFTGIRSERFQRAQA